MLLIIKTEYLYIIVFHSDLIFLSNVRSLICDGKMVFNYYIFVIS